MAKSIVDLATGTAADDEKKPAEAQQRGGLKGGKAQSEALTPERRAEIAQKAAEARWG